MSVNRVVLIGNLGAEPNLTLTSAQLPICTFPVATTERLAHAISHTEWHRIVVFGHLAVNCSKFLQKGHEVCVEGSLRSTRYADERGVLRQIYRIVSSSVTFLKPPRSPEEESVWVEICGAVDETDLVEP